jgi:hypothetical protein
VLHVDWALLMLVVACVCLLRWPSGGERAPMRVRHVQGRADDTTTIMTTSSDTSANY